MFTLVGRASISPLLQNANIFFGSEDDTNCESFILYFETSCSSALITQFSFLSFINRSHADSSRLTASFLSQLDFRCFGLDCTASSTISSICTFFPDVIEYSRLISLFLDDFRIRRTVILQPVAISDDRKKAQSELFWW